VVIYKRNGEFYQEHSYGTDPDTSAG
jgi:hypothetical protein